MVFVSEQSQQRIELFVGNGVFQLQIPVARWFFFPSETKGAGGKVKFALAIGHDQFPIGIFLVGVLRDISRPQESSHLIIVSIFVENDKEWLVGVLFGVLDEVGRFLVDIKFLQDDMDTSHQVGAVASGNQRNPGICVFRDIGIVG